MHKCLRNISSRRKLSIMACTTISVLLLVTLVISDECFCASSHAQLSVTELLSSNNADIRSRPRRKATLRDTSPPVAYMMQLRDSLADGNGRPRTAADDPTNVWCLLDKDLMDEVHRPKPSNTKCKVLHRFRFSMKALQETFQHNDLRLQKGILRVHVNVIERYLKQQASIDTQISSSFTVTQSNGNSTQTVYGGQEDMVVTVDSNGWIELNVTCGLQEIQSISSEIADTFDLTVTISVDCKENRKVPMTFADPASVPLSQGPRRQRLTNLQPMLLVHLSDDHLKTEIQQEAEPPTDSEILEVEVIEKRSTRGCHLEDFLVNFQNIELTYVLAPFEYNAHKCVGSCAHSVLRSRGNLATNHAKIMASAVAFQDYDPQTPFHHQPTEPCCVPTKYESMSLLIFIDNELNYAVYPTMAVTACGCR